MMAAPVRSRGDLDRLRELDMSALAPISQAVGLAVAELGKTPLIGFGGAPFTLASYLIEGGPSRELPITRALMHDDPNLWAEILTWTAGVTSQFLRAQVLAGASAIQLFDSWAGRLTLDEYRTFAAPYSKVVMGAISDLPVARVHFGTMTKDLLRDMYDVGASVMGIDQFTPLDWANEVLGGRVPLQGNIDPELLSAPWPELRSHVEDVLVRGSGAPSHVVNLGHGVPPDTDPDVLTRLVTLVRGES
jgi:uroporphyrinogen decarboxylase